MDPTLRIGEEADLEPLLELMRRFYAFDQIPFEDAAARQAVSALLGEHSLGLVWLICDGTAPVGYAVLTYGYSLEYHGRDAFVDELFIDADYRGRGWGTTALRRVEDAARGVGIRALHLEVAHRNRRAQEVYRKLGFEAHDRHLMTKWIGRPDAAGAP